MEPLTIWETFERSKSFFSDKTAILFVNAEGKEEAYSYHKLSYDTEVFARGLKESGIGKGDNVCLCLSNSPLMITAYLALSKLGAVSVLINPVLPKNRVKKIVEDVSAKLLIDQNGAGEVFSKAHSLVALTCGATKADCGPLDTAAILYSSGTTGEQKGAELTVSNIHSNISYTSALTGMTPEDRMICFLPLTHCFGLNFILGACLYTGATLVLHEKFDLSLVLDSLVKNKVTMFFAVPQIYNMMLKQKIGPFYFSSVRYFFYAADSMSVDSILAWEQEYGRKIYTGWGLTETSPFATSNHEVIYKLGSVGKQIPGVDVKVVDEQFNYVYDANLQVVLPGNKSVKLHELEPGKYLGSVLLERRIPSGEQEIKIVASVEKNGSTLQGNEIIKFNQELSLLPRASRTISTTLDEE